MDRDDINFQVTGDCGHQFEITLGRLKQEGQLTCPACGYVETPSEEELAAFDAYLGTVVSDDTAKNIGKALGDHFANRIPGFKRKR